MIRGFGVANHGFDRLVPKGARISTSLFTSADADQRNIEISYSPTLNASCTRVLPRSPAVEVLPVKKSKLIVIDKVREPPPFRCNRRASVETLAARCDQA